MKYYVIIVMIITILFTLSGCAVTKKVAESGSEEENLLSVYLDEIVIKNDGTFSSAKAYTVSGSNDFYIKIRLRSLLEQEKVKTIAERVFSFLKDEKVYTYINGLYGELGYINIAFIYEKNCGKPTHVYYCHSFYVDDPELYSDWEVKYNWSENDDELSH